MGGLVDLVDLVAGRFPFSGTGVDFPFGFETEPVDCGAGVKSGAWDVDGAGDGVGNGVGNGDGGGDVVGGGMGCDDDEGCGVESEGSTGSDMDSWGG